MRLDTVTPWDLYAVGLGVLATVLVVLVDPWGPLRVVLGLPFVLFFPGYALVAALFPERHRSYEVAKGEDAEEVEEVEEGIDGLERVALSLGLSIAVVPLLGLGLNYTPWGIRLVPILVAVAGFTVAALGVAWVRRGALPVGERFRVRVEVEGPAWGEYSVLDKVLTVALGVSVLFAAGALVYVLSTDRVGERFSEFYILGPGGMASEYPTNVSVNESGVVIVGLTNQEHSVAGYDVSVVAQQGEFVVEDGGNRSFVPLENRTLETWEISLAHNETEEREVSFGFEEAGAYRVLFLLEMEGAQEEPYRRLHLWVTVGEG